jgi:hypothetical protein
VEQYKTSDEKKMRMAIGRRLPCCLPEDTSTNFWWMGNGGTTPRMIRPAGIALERKTTSLMFEPNKGLSLCFFMSDA